MRNPTKQQMQSVIDTLEKAVKLADGNCPVDMHEGEVHRDHPCGSPMCFAGWYGLVESNGYHYSAGMDHIAAVLGFQLSGQLKIWAHENPTIWGNNYGFLMFSYDRAFTGDADIEVPNLQYIINHLKGVRDRLPE